MISDYRDGGCDLAPSCLDCPFVVCRYDLRGGRGVVVVDRRSKAVQAYERGLSRRQAASVAGISVRTLNRALRDRSKTAVAL